MGLTRLSPRSRTRVAEPPTSSGTSPVRPSPRSRSRAVRAYIALTKPRIIELLLVTTVPTMVVADRGIPSVWLMVATVIGGTLAAGGANAINMYVDRDIDRLMERTKNRPLVTGEVAPGRALVFAIVLEALAFAWLWGFVNLLSAALAVSATAFYVFVYTLWLKRTSTRNIIIGGAAGAVPVLVGWSAVTNSLGWAPLVLFGLIFYWTPPHFWALAIRYRDDYQAANVPMLPAVASTRTTAVRIIGYTVVLWGLSMLFSAVGEMGLVYTVSAIVLGAVFLFFAVQVLRTQAIASAMRLFSYSITYITLLFGAMVVDQVVRTGV
ncbi:MAG: heme o synthase [Acidimicrobiia bacterium]|nr:heme o synthase [Acidimicrobiia bacterium]MCY4432558.1 heme o synthase [bacterium]